MSDNKKVNTTEVHEKDYILYEVLKKSKSSENREILDNLTEEYKIDNDIKIITDKNIYYEFLKKNKKKFENIKKNKNSK